MIDHMPIKKYDKLFLPYPTKGARLSVHRVLSSLNTWEYGSYNTGVLGSHYTQLVFHNKKDDRLYRGCKGFQCNGCYALIM